MEFLEGGSFYADALVDFYNYVCVGLIIVSFLIIY